MLDDRIKPPAAALWVEPLTIDKLDNHPFGVQFWATIVEMRKEHAQVVSELEDRDENLIYSEADIVEESDIVENRNKAHVLEILMSGDSTEEIIDRLTDWAES